MRQPRTGQQTAIIDSPCTLVDPQPCAAVHADFARTDGRRLTRRQRLLEPLLCDDDPVLTNESELIGGLISSTQAVIRMSQNGWRRAGPGQISSLEMSSMLPRARKVLREAGVDEASFRAGSGLPVGLYEIATSRIPASAALS